MNNKIFSIHQLRSNFSGIIVATIVLYFYKTAFWPLTYLFIISYVLVIVSFLFSFKGKLKLSGFFHDFMPPIILAGIFILAFLLNGEYSIDLVKKDILLILVLFSLFYFLYWNCIILKNQIPVSFTISLIIALSLIISLLNLLNLVYISFLPFDIVSRLHISNGTTIANDNNLFSLFILFSLVILNFRNPNINFSFNHSRWLKHFLNLIFVLNIILSGSRRGIIVLIILFFIFCIYSLVLITKGSVFKKVFKNIITFFIITSIYFILGVIVYQALPTQKISNTLKKYALLAGRDDFRPIERFLWERDPGIPKDKNYIIDKLSFIKGYKYWGSHFATGTTLSFIETPYGKGIKVSRESGNSGGFSLSYIGPQIIYYRAHTYKISFKIKFIKGDFNSFNIGWWINDGGKGFSNTVALEKVTEPIENGWFSCSSEYTFIDSHIGMTGFLNAVADQTSFMIADFELVDLDYNSQLPRFVYEYKGKENIDVFLGKYNSPDNELNLINNGDFRYDLAFWKHTSDSLKVNVTNINGKNCAFIHRGNGNGVNWTLYYTGRSISFKRNNEYEISFKLKPVSPKTIPFSVGYWLDEGDGYIISLRLKIDTLKDGWLNVRANYTFKNDQTNLFFPIGNQIDNSEFYITDISLVNLSQPQSQVLPDSYVEDKKERETSVSDRSSRWVYAIDLWKTKYKWQNRLFGHGFDYLEWYGEKFMNDSKKYDWPHNPLISVLLYSGVLGLAAYLWLLYKTIYLYLRYIKKYSVFFIAFLLTYFFSFFSGSSPFDPPVMGFFMLLPFILHSINKNNRVTEENIDYGKNSDYRKK
jgi:hypothetical protein